MKEKVNQIIIDYEYMGPRIFGTYKGDPIKLLKEYGEYFLGDKEYCEWLRIAMGGAKGIHLSDDGDSLRS